MEDSQKKGKGASGGQRIDDHSSWMGSRSPESILPMGVKSKHESSAEGAGSLMKYEDTTESIRASQEEGKKKAKAHPTKQPNYRN